MGCRPRLFRELVQDSTLQRSAENIGGNAWQSSSVLVDQVAVEGRVKRSLSCLLYVERESEKEACEGQRGSSVFSTPTHTSASPALTELDWERYAAGEAKGPGYSGHETSIYYAPGSWTCDTPTEDDW